MILSNSIFVYLSRVDDSNKDKTGEGGGGGGGGG